MPDNPTDPVEAATKAAWDALADDETDVNFVDPGLGTIDGHFDLRAVMSAAIAAYREALAPTVRYAVNRAVYDPGRYAEPRPNDPGELEQTEQAILELLEIMDVLPAASTTEDRDDD